MADPISWILGSTLFKGAERLLGSNTAKFAGNMYANSVNAGLNTTAGQNMEDKILMGRKHGIHPLEAIGGNTNAGATVAMQNPMGGTTQVQQKDPIEEETKRRVLQSLIDEANDRKWKYSLLVPVSMKGEKNKKYWGLNSHYFGYTFLASTIQMAANGNEAFLQIMEQLSPTQRKEIKDKIKRHKLTIPDSSYTKGTGVHNR